MVGFNYVIEMVPDKKYGALDPETGEWNGVVRQILEKVRFDRRVVVFFFFLNNSARFCMNLKIVKNQNAQNGRFIGIAESRSGRRIDDDQLRSGDGH